MILVVSHADDVHASYVLEALARRGARVATLDLAALPQAWGLSISAGRDGADGAVFLGPGGAAVRGEEVRSVWWRRPRRYQPHPELSEAHRAWAAAQVHGAVSGTWGALRARWMNDPWRDERASHKPLQLAEAGRAGLAVPPTLITSVPEDARTFLEELGDRPAIHKPLVSTEETFRHTRRLTARDRDRLDALRYGPAILQAWVPGVDVRVTVVGERVFATDIDARATTSPDDFRPAFAQAQVEPCRLPWEVEAGVRRLVAALGLRYAAIDLRRTDDGWFFLESNPAGQWLFLEDRTGQPITAAVADALIEPAGPVTDAEVARQTE
jgi:hypothetical protein